MQPELDKIFPTVIYKGSFEEFPENPEPYDTILKDNKVWLYLGDHWEEITSSEWDFFEELNKILKEVEDSKLREAIWALLNEYQERNRLYNGIPTTKDTF